MEQILPQTHHNLRHLQPLLVGGFPMLLLYFE